MFRLYKMYLCSYDQKRTTPHQKSWSLLSTTNQSCYYTSIFQVCEQLPGCGLSGSGFFSVEGCLKDQHELTTTLTLFGGLVHGRVNSLDVKLGIPELPETTDQRFVMMTVEQIK